MARPVLHISAWLLWSGRRYGGQGSTAITPRRAQIQHTHTQREVSDHDLRAQEPSHGKKRLQLQRVEDSITEIVGELQWPPDGEAHTTANLYIYIFINSPQDFHVSRFPTEHHSETLAGYRGIDSDGILQWGGADNGEPPGRGRFPHSILLLRQLKTELKGTREGSQVRRLTFFSATDERKIRRRAWPVSEPVF